jgi:hypothetical protein
MRRIPAKMQITRGLALGSLCIALVLMSGMIQAAHFHACAQPDHDCALCMTAHSVAQATPPVALLFTSLRVEALPAARTIARPRDAVHFRLASRPPPLPSLA